MGLTVIAVLFCTMLQPMRKYRLQVAARTSHEFKRESNYSMAIEALELLLSVDRYLAWKALEAAEDQASRVLSDPAEKGLISCVGLSSC